MKKHIPEAIFKLILTIFLLNLAYVTPSSAASETYTNMSSGTSVCSVGKQHATSEWSQFLNDFNGGKLFSNINNVFLGESSRGYSMLHEADAEACRLGEVFTRDAIWLFASALIGFVGLSNKRRV